MAADSSRTADVLVIGGGVAGSSSAMQLAFRGRKVIVLERAMLGSGSTGRAAGLLGQLRSTHAATQLLKDGLTVVRELQRRTGHEIFVETGSLRLAATPDRAAEIRDHVALGKEVGLPVDHIDKKDVAKLLPYMRCDDLLDACYCPTDGHLQPAELLASFVQAGRESGVVFETNSPVEQVHIKNGRVTGVRAAGRDYSAPVVLNSTGPWSYLVAELGQARLPTAAIGHYYLTTAPLAETPVDRHSPAVRDRGNLIYSRPEAGGLILGMYEENPVEYDMERLGPDFDMSQMHARRDELNVAQLINAAAKRFPFINERTPMKITTGIMTFTPDGQPMCGKSAEIEGLFHCAGFCGHGIVQSPSIGVVMAELIIDGRSRYDVAQIEADRFFDIPQLHDRLEVKRQARETYAGYYGKVAGTDTAK